jgi:hypothetical protein
VDRDEPHGGPGVEAADRFVGERDCPSGAPGTLGLLEGQYDYLLAYRAAVAELVNSASPVDDPAVAAELARQAR